VAHQRYQRSQAAEEEIEQANAGLATGADELARSNKDLEQFAYVVSHDFRSRCGW